MPPRPGSRRTPWRHGGDGPAFAPYRVRYGSAAKKLGIQRISKMVGTRARTVDPLSLRLQESISNHK
jgi:hypothetical protein